MIIFTTPCLLWALIAMCAIHIVTSILPGIVAKILNYANIALHLATLVQLMYFRAEVDEALLLYMISMLAYTAVAYVKYYILRAITARRDREEEEV